MFLKWEIGREKEKAGLSDIWPAGESREQEVWEEVGFFSVDSLIHIAV